MLENRKNRLVFVALVIVAAGLVIAAPAVIQAEDSVPDSPPLVTAGQKVIPFTLSNLDGEKIDLNATLEKKPAIILFWSLFCQPCKEEIPLLEKLYQKYKDKVEIVAVTMNDARLKRAIAFFVQDAKVSFPVLMDNVSGASCEVADSYGVKETPTIIGVDQSSSVVFVKLGRGEESDLEKLFKKLL